MILVYVLLKVLWVLAQAVGWLMFWMAMSVFLLIWFFVSLPLRVIRG